MLKPLGTATTPTATGPAKGPRPASSPPTSHCIRTFYQAWLKVGAREYTLYMSAFVPLRVHSHYSLLKALPKIPALVARAQAEGCQTLLQIVTKSHLNSPGAPLLTQAVLDEHQAGLIVLDPKDTDLPMREVFYLGPEDRRAWETLRAIENRGPVDSGDIDEEEDDFSFPTAAYMESRFGAEALKKTADLAAQCDLDLNLGQWFFPDIEIPQGATYDQELRRLVEEGLTRRFLQMTPDIPARIESEYEIITNKGKR